MLQNAALRLASALTPFQSHRYLQLLCGADFEPLAVQSGRREQRLAELIEHAIRETALYAERLPHGLRGSELARPDVFATLPITRKQDLRDGFPDRQLARSYRARRLRYSNTSGTTGQPLLLAQDVDDISWKHASILRSRVMAGLDPTARQARLTPNECQPSLPGGDSDADRWWRAEHRAQRLFVALERRLVHRVLQPRLMLEPLWGSRAETAPVDLEAVLERIERFDPDYLTLYPPYALLLADELRRTGRRPPTRRGVIDFSAGLCTPSMRARITEAFGRPTAQGCGGCEFARYGASCPEDPDRMHLAETYCYVETLRPDGSPCASGEVGNVVVTSLHGRAMPILRLEPGDVARLIEEPCACGRRSRRIEHHGRIHSVIRTSDGRWVTGRQVWDRLFAIPGVSLFEFRQESPSAYHLLVLPQVDLAPQPDALQHAIRDLVGEDVSLRVVTVDRLRTQASGKLQLVRSATFESFRVPTERSHQVPIN